MTDKITNRIKNAKKIYKFMKDMKLDKEEMKKTLSCLYGMIFKNKVNASIKEIKRATKK